MTTYIRLILLAATLAAFAPQARAIVDVTVACPNLTIFEDGVLHSVHCNFDNHSGETVTFTSFTADAAQFVSGDQSDLISGIAWGIGDGTCGLTVITGTICTLRLGILPDNGSGETDGDFGIWFLAVHANFTVPSGDPTASTGSTITIADPTSTVPEPATLALLGLGLAGLGFSRRKQ